MLSRNALAEHWQISPQAVSKLRARGCPMTSLAEADAWRSRNISTRTRSNGTKPAPIPNKLTADEADATSMMAAEGRLHRPTVEKNLRLLEQLTEQGRAALADAIERGESENARRWTITILNLVARSAIVAKSLQELLEHDEVVVSMDFVNEMMTRGLIKQRDLVASAVDTLPHQLNPADPAHSREILHDWYMGTFLRSMFNEFSESKIPPERWPQDALEAAPQRGRSGLTSSQ
jgi:hypothetical protein